MKRLTIAAAVVIALIGACTRVSTPTGPTPTARQTTTAAPAPTTTPHAAATPPPTVAVNEEARDDALAFNVAIVLADDYAPGLTIDDKIYAQGVFVEVALYVSNIGAVPHRCVAAYQRLVDGKGRLYAPDPRAAPETAEVDVNPGNRAAVYLWFDVPKGTTPTDYVLLLHAAPGSEGVAVTLPDEYRWTPWTVHGP